MIYDGARWREPWDAHLVEPPIELVWEDPPPVRSTPGITPPPWHIRSRTDPYGHRRYTNEGDPTNPCQGGLPSLGKGYS